MVPREIFNYATSRGTAHLLNNFGMSMQMLECCCDRVDVTGLHDNSFHAIAHHIRQVEAMPCLEHMLDAFAFDQSTREDGAKFGRPISWFESFHVHPAGQVKKFFLRKTTYAKG